MKKLISLLLCSVMLCSVFVFPMSAGFPFDVEEDMTAEEYENKCFGEHYVTDAEAAEFAIAGYPGVKIPYLEYLFKDSLRFSLGENSEEKLALLKEYFPMENYISSVEDNQLDVCFYHPVVFPLRSLSEDQFDVDYLMLNIKVLYTLTQINKACDGAEVEVKRAIQTYGDYGKSLTADVNGDLKINAKDILAIKRFMVGIDYRIAFHNDPNSDNAINAKDILQIKRYMVGVDDYTDYIIYPGEGGTYYNPIKGHFNK